MGEEQVIIDTFFDMLKKTPIADLREIAKQHNLKIQIVAEDGTLDFFAEVKEGGGNNE